MKFDEILEYLGSFGKYQKIQLALVCLAAIPCAFYSTANTFLSASSDHYCLTYDNQTYNDVSTLKNCTIPYDNDGSEWSKCNRYNVTLSPQPDCYSGRDDTLECDNGWVYDRSTYERTVVHDFDLVCDKDWMKQLSKSIVLLGKLVGAVLFGQLSDRVGRRPVFFFSVVFGIVVGILTAFSPTYALFACGQFLLGMAASGMYLVAFVIGIELVGISERKVSALVITGFFAFGYMILAVVAKILDGHWRKLQLVLCLLCLPLLSYYWLIPESIRWLVQQGKFDKAEQILEKAAKTNDVKIPDDVFAEEKQEREKKQNLHDEEVKRKYNALDLMKTPNLRKRSLNVYFNWFCNSMVYYGLSLNTDGLAKNAYISFFVSGAVEIPAYILCYFLLDRTGRRPLLFVFMLIGGVVLIITGPMMLDPSLQAAVSTFAFLGKFCIAGSYAIIYFWATELFPTPVRNAGLGVSSMCARIGGILSPYIMLLGDYVSLSLPFIIFGILSILAALLALLLPETLNHPLPETLEEGETFATKDYKRETQNGMVDVGQQADFSGVNDVQLSEIPNQGVQGHYTNKGFDVE
ncbi:organic cation transporter protein-like [Glandiceps talaboti]